MDVESNTSNKEQAEAIKARANKEFSAKNFESATELYSEAIALDPSNALLFGNRAASRIMLEQYEGALEDASRSVELDPSFVKGYVRMGKCYLQLGRLLESKRAYQQALELEPAGSYIAKEMQAVDNVSTIIEAAKEKLNPTEPGVTPEPHTALRYLQRAIAICGEIPAILLMQAEAALMEKDYDLATKIATGLLHKNPDNPEALYIRGLAYYYNAKFPLAVNHFKQVLARDPDHSKARSAWRRARDLEAKKQAGNEAFQSRDFTSAAQLYTEALAIDPELTSFNSILHYNRGASRYQLADYQGCYDDCSKAIEYNEDYGKAYAKRAAAALKLEKYEESVRDYQRAYEMDPDNRNLKQELKQAKLELKKSKRKDYYKILGVAKDADENQIKKAYHKQALKHHPDRHQGDESKEQAELMFKEVGEAYAVLSDPQKRRRYDSGQDLEEIEGHGGVNPADIFAQMFGGGGGFGGFGGGFGGDFGGFGGGFGGGHHHFGGGGGGRRGHPFGF